MSATTKSSQPLQFERGFKTWAENTSVSLRDRMSLAPTDSLNPFALARYMGVRVLDINKLPLSEEAKTHLCSPEGDEWSALTVRAGTVDAIILNPSHSPARRVSDMAHELSHLLRQHKPAQIYVDPFIKIGMRSFDRNQEDEANWLSGCLLLPRVVLVHATHKNWNDDFICQHYGVSVQMLKFRRNVSGVGKQARSVKVMKAA